MVDPISKPSDKADRPQSPRPVRVAAKCGVCFAALLGIVVRPRTAEQGPRLRGCDPKRYAGTLISMRGRWHPLRCPIPLCGAHRRLEERTLRGSDAADVHRIGLLRL